MVRAHSHAVDKCLILYDVTAQGPVIGYYLGRPIHDRVADRWRRIYTYAGVIERYQHGNYDPTRLAPLEFILEPGIVYRMQIPERKRRRLRSTLGRWWRGPDV
ncbi:MAG: hypothetical protein JSR99_02210 [Proteobacteria bacterium]|nr:hypothetical protein [Pseudomonadota bacterium]